MKNEQSAKSNESKPSSLPTSFPPNPVRAGGGRDAAVKIRETVVFPFTQTPNYHILFYYDISH
jgi:hypothetical protein